MGFSLNVSLPAGIVHAVCPCCLKFITKVVPSIIIPGRNYNLGAGSC